MFKKSRPIGILIVVIVVVFFSLSYLLIQQFEGSISSKWTGVEQCGICT